MAQSGWGYIPGPDWVDHMRDVDMGDGGARWALVVVAAAILLLLIT